MGNDFSVQRLADQTGKVVIITGANTGIGRETALHLLYQRAHVILACRSAERTLPVVEQLKEETGNPHVDFMELDLSSLQSVEQFCDAFVARKLPLHTLINNAGIMAPPFGLSKDGIEQQFAINHLGHFLLTARLMPLLLQSTPSRVVNVSSSMHRMPYSGGLRLESLNDEATYGAWNSYGQSKLCNILFNLELDRRLGEKRVFCNVLHPGVVSTELTRNLKDGKGALTWITTNVASKMAVSVQKGALTSLFCAGSDEIFSKKIRGQYFEPTATPATPSALARSEQLQEKLWKFSEELISEKLGKPFTFDL